MASRRGHKVQHFNGYPGNTVIEGFGLRFERIYCGSNGDTYVAILHAILSCSYRCPELATDRLTVRYRTVPYGTGTDYGRTVRAAGHKTVLYHTVPYG